LFQEQNSGVDFDDRQQAPKEAGLELNALGTASSRYTADTKEKQPFATKSSLHLTIRRTVGAGEEDREGIHDEKRNSTPPAKAQNQKKPSTNAIINEGRARPKGVGMGCGFLRDTCNAAWEVTQES
jgi:hypothetical protein